HDFSRSPDLAHAVRGQESAADVVDPVVAAERGNAQRGGLGTGSNGARGIRGQEGRPIGLILPHTHHPPGWGRQGRDREYFLKFSPDAYAVGINAALYSLTH